MLRNECADRISPSTEAADMQNVQITASAATRLRVDAPASACGTGDPVPQ